MKSNKNLGHYRLIKDKDKGEESIKTYWKIIDSNNVGITLSDEFKKLFIKMVDYDPELRPSAEDILNDEWFKEINELKKDENKLLEVEGEIREIFINFADQVKKHNKKRIEAKKKKLQEEGYKVKVGNNKTMFFALDSKAEEIYIPINMNNCIEIKGELNPAVLMNIIYDELLNKYDNNIFIDKNWEKEDELILKISLEEKGEELSEEIKEELIKLGMNIKDFEEYNNLNMDIKCYKYYDIHILRFILKEGNRTFFLDKFEEISKMITDIIC